MNSSTSQKESRQRTSQRAGTIGAQFAAQQLDRYIRSNVAVISFSLVFVLLLSGGIWLLFASRPGIQGLATGLVAGVGASHVYHWIVLSSGAAAATMGQWAEEQTAAELRRLRRKGWKHVSHLVIKKDAGDVDHVAVGPDGVLVIETKWRSSEIDVDSLPKWIDDAVWQAKRNREDVRRFLGWQRDTRLIEALVVLWGPGVTHDSCAAVLRNDVNVVAGDNLRAELENLSDVRLDPGEIDQIYGSLRDRIQVRDKWERENLDAAPITIRERAIHWAWNAAASWVGLALSLLTLNFGWWAVPAVSGLMLASLLARKAERIRSQAIWFFTGVLAMVPLVLVAVLWTLL